MEVDCRWGHDSNGLYNVTITNNTADSDSSNGGDGGGIQMASENVTLIIRNNIVAGNLDNSSAGTIHPDCSGTLSSRGYNLVENLTGCIITGSTSGNITGLSPLLGPLQNKGGQILTHGLLTVSPAIDAGNPQG